MSGLSPWINLFPVPGEPGFERVEAAIAEMIRTGQHVIIMDDGSCLERIDSPTITDEPDYSTPC